MEQFNKVSDDTHMLIEKMADSRVALVSRKEGRGMSDNERGVVVGQLRRQLSTASIRAASQCLLDRMHQCGEGAALASKRREVNFALEERMRESYSGSQSSWEDKLSRKDNSSEIKYLCSLSTLATSLLSMTPSTTGHPA